MNKKTIENIAYWSACLGMGLTATIIILILLLVWSKINTELLLKILLSNCLLWWLVNASFRAAKETLEEEK